MFVLKLINGIRRNVCLGRIDAPVAKRRKVNDDEWTGGFLFISF